MAIQCSNSGITIQGGINLNSCYIRIEDIRLNIDSTYVYSRIKVYTDSTSYTNDYNNYVTITFGNNINSAYNRISDGADILDFAHDKWIEKLYILYPDWNGTGLTKIEL